MAKKKNDFSIDVVSVRLVKDAPLFSDHRLTNADEVVEALGGYLCDFDREVVCIINLRSDGTPINVHFASMGSVNEAFAHPRELFKASILSNAANIIMVHCHPSGNLEPSKADTMITDRMIKLCTLMEIPLLDHIIVGGKNDKYFSFREKDLIKMPCIPLSTDYRALDFEQPLVAENGKAR